MYPFDSSRLRSLRPTHWRGIRRNVVLLGLVSMFTDISGEMVWSVLPVYLVYVLHLSPLRFGFIEGLSRIAFKRRVGVGERFGRFAWRLYVLDLATFTETALASESRSVDDQVEWLDDQHILYALPDERVSAVMNT